MNGTVIRFSLALIVLLLLAGAVGIMSFFVVPDSNREVVVQLIGGVNTLAGLVIGYYFGSSAKHDDPNRVQDVNVINPPSQPVPTEAQP